MDCELRWRWDQGRLEYFKFENVVAMARVLSELDGIPLNGPVDLLRGPLMNGTGLPFAPAHYKVWRNYARVFACSMLAISVDGRLVITELCRKLAQTPLAITPDQYFDFVFSRFTFPYPAFDGYNAKVAPTFPFAAIAKFALAKGTMGISLDEVFACLVGNSCTGCEDLSHYAKLPLTDRRPIGDEERQVREMMVFMGQSSFMRWFDKRLYVDTSEVRSVIKALSPIVRGERKSIPAEEFLRMTNASDERDLERLDVKLADREPIGLRFLEGRRTFGAHGRIERSPMVRKFYFQSHPDLICDACRMHPKEKYPWTENILELHHLLPLSSTINVNGTTTSLDDLVPLCPSCHRSIHEFYRLKLDEWGVEDFGSKKMARDVYEFAKREIA